MPWDCSRSAENEICQYRGDLLVIGPHRFVGDSTVSVDNVDHVRKRAIPTMHGAIEIVHQQLVLNAVLLPAIFGELQLLFPRCMRRIVFPRVGLSYINRQELESTLLIIFVKLIQRRDLADEGRSRNAAEFQQHVLCAAKLRKADSFPFDSSELKVGSFFSGTNVVFEVAGFARTFGTGEGFIVVFAQLVQPP